MVVLIISAYLVIAFFVFVLQYYLAARRYSKSAYAKRMYKLWEYFDFERAFLLSYIWPLFLAVTSAMFLFSLIKKKIDEKYNIRD